MIYLVWAFRCMFCRHQFVLEPYIRYHIDRLGAQRRNDWISATCKLCGWHRSYRCIE